MKTTRRILLLFLILAFLFALIRIGTSTYENAVRDRIQTAQPSA